MEILSILLCRSCRLGEKPSTLSKMDVAASVAGQTQFTVDLYKTLVKGKESENVVLSPLSVDLALAMLTAGAKGPTREQISKCIKLPQGKPLHDFSSHLRKTVLSNQQGDGGPELALANRLWVEQSVKLKPAFQKILQESYGSEAASVDFISKVLKLISFFLRLHKPYLASLLPIPRMICFIIFYIKSSIQVINEPHRTIS